MRWGSAKWTVEYPLGEMRQNNFELVEIPPFKALVWHFDLWPG
jgi:hypothetical protein